MSITFLNSIRRSETVQLSLKKQFLQGILFFIAGAFLGFVSKYIESIPHEGQLGNILSITGNIFTGIGIWAFLATIIAATSRSPLAAGIHVFLFFAGLILAYYLYSMELFGFFPSYYFFRWGAIAVCSPFAAYIAWYGRGDGWISAVCAALPISLLLEQSYGVLSIYSGLNFIIAILLLAVLSKNIRQAIKIIPVTLVVAVILIRFHVLSYLIGGL